MGTKLRAGVVSSVALATLLALAPTAASAEANACGSITATGRAANPANYEPPRHYDMNALARRRAIEAWRAKTAEACPRSSNIWWRARNRAIACEGYAGGLGCEATGVPAPRLFR